MLNSLIKENISLKDKCFYKTGGSARYYAEPKYLEELIYCLDFAREKKIESEVIGHGANLLISDNGFNGFIISMTKYSCYISKENENIVSCGAGLKLSDFVDFAVDRGLKGTENLAGIPGSIGGAIIMNAGAFGTEIKDIITEIKTIDSSGKIKILTNKEALFSYRKSKGLKDLIVIEGKFSLEKDNRETLIKIKKEILQKRREKQPLHKPSCGSVFKRPDVGYAGKYIEDCGLKGLKKGGALVSERHANFILNDNNATSRDIKWLIDEVILKVKEKYNIILEPEVRFIGF